MGRLSVRSGRLHYEQVQIRLRSPAACAVDGPYVFRPAAGGGWERWRRYFFPKVTYGSTGGGKDPWNFYVVTHGRAPAWCVLQVVRCEGRVWLVSPVLVVVVMTRCRRLSVRMLVLLKCG